jgi:multiple sugar transport system substrate-binding protein
MVFIAFIFILRGSGTSTGGEAQLTVWGVFDDSNAFNDAIAAFQKMNRNISVSYRLIPYADYEQTLLNALAAGKGPDIFMIHSTWLPQDIAKLQPMPARAPDADVPLMTIRQFQDTFVDVAVADLINDNKIYAMPLYVDTLALFYNRDLLSSAGIAVPPKTWTDFMDDVEKLTQLDQSRNIVRSGAAIGTARNINRSTDILMMLMLQSGVRMTNSDNTQATFAQSVDNVAVGERSLQFYTDFANPSTDVYTWNDSQDYNIDAFTAGKTAMIINYAHQTATIRAAAPRLNFGIAAIPQPTTSDRRTYADYWALAVALQSKHPNEAWQFVTYMTAGDGTIPYLNATARPSARRDLIDQQKSDPDLGVFAEQALTARSWFQIDNAAIETIFADMIDAVNLGRSSVKDALRDAEEKVTVLMSYQ